jgi:cell division protein FtsQ
MILPSPSLPRRPPARAVGACVAVLALLGGGWLWLRDSSLVAVRQVDVSGLSGADAPRVRVALQDAARDMTTLHVRNGQLATAVEPFPAVRAVEAHADFPHGLKIVVHEHVAVGAIAAGSTRVAVAADGTLLRGTTTSGLPLIDVRVSPGGDALTDRRALRAVAPGRCGPWRCWPPRRRPCAPRFAASTSGRAASPRRWTTGPCSSSAAASV